jgi:P2 family phage contractile tail tube protein
MAARDVRKNLNAFVDGQGMAGQLDDFNAPKLATKDEEWRGGGMLGAVDLSMGMEKLAADMSFISYSANVLALFGVVVGAKVPFVVREALESHDGTVTAVVHTMRGRINSMDPGTSKAGDKPTLRIALALDYYKLEHGGVVLQEHDMINMIHIANGVDQTAAQRAALGL